MTCTGRSGELAQQLRGPAALPEDLTLVCGHPVGGSQVPITLAPWNQMLSEPFGHLHIHDIHSHRHKIGIKS